MVRRQNWALVLIAGLAATVTLAQTANDHRRMLVIYDSSNSMWGELADKSRKYEAGRSALSNFLESDLQDRLVGFRAYGHRDKKDCRDSELVVPFSDLDVARTQISTAVADIRPTGMTPITHSLREGLKDFGGLAGDILLVSDGIETCDIDPCELMRDWQASNVSIRVHVVGVGLTNVERVAMSCIAEVSGGKYFDANSADSFAEALNEAGDAIENPYRGEAAPVAMAPAYAFSIVATDDQGRSYIAKGKLFQDGEEKGDAGSHQRNILEGPGEYEIEVGPVLSDDTVYKPVRTSFTIEEPGEMIIEVTVIRPAIVTAKFLENGEEHSGSFVTANQDAARVFGFRAFDEALARPGAYEFLAEPNADNKLLLTETLVEGEHTALVFDITRTIQFYVRYEMPNGEIFRRGSELWLDGKKVYGVYSGNPTTVRPGMYELHAEDQNLPLTPVEIEIEKDGETIVVPIDAGWLRISYAPSEFDYVGEPDRAWLESLDRGNSSFARIDTPIAVKPGRYRAKPQTSRGFFDSIDVDVLSNETAEVIFEPKPLGEIIVNYAPSANWPKEPDRAAVSVLDGQPILNGFMRPGVAKKFLPGRYSVRGGGSSSDAVSQEVIVRPHETITVTLKHKLNQ